MGKGEKDEDEDTKGEKDEDEDEVNDEKVVVGDDADLGVVFIPGSSEFDIEDIDIEAFAFVKSCTAEYGENIPAGSKCVELFLTFDSYSGDLSEADLTLMSTDVEDTIESGTFAEEILKTGLAATVIVPLPPALATDAPTSKPTTLADTETDPPTLFPSVAPTAEATIEIVDLCPEFESCGDCVKEIGGNQCLWCLDEKKCYNADPVIAEISALEGDIISKRQLQQQQVQHNQQQRFLEDVATTSKYSACEKLSASKAEDCVIATEPPTVVPVVAPTDKPVVAPTDAPLPPSEAPTMNPTEIFVDPNAKTVDAESGGNSSSLLSSSVMTTILSGIGMTMVLFSTM